MIVGPAYALKERKADVQRSINLTPTHIEAGRAQMYLQPVPGLKSFSSPPVEENPCTAVSPDPAVFSLQRMESYPFVDTVALTSTFQRELAVTLGAPGTLVQCSEFAALGDALLNGPIFYAHRGWGPTLHMAEAGFTVEFFIYREGGAVYDAGKNWEWSGSVNFSRESGYTEEQVFGFWWRGGVSFGGTEIGMGMSGDVLWANNTSVAQVPPDGVWTHVAWVVDSEMRCYVAGQLVLTVALNDGPMTTDHQFKSVTLDNFYGDTHVRAVDEYRVTGRILYTGNFTPPAIIFPDPNP